METGEDSAGVSVGLGVEEGRGVGEGEGRGVWEGQGMTLPVLSVSGRGVADTSKSGVGGWHRVQDVYPRDAASHKVISPMVLRLRLEQFALA